VQKATLCFTSSYIFLFLLGASLLSSFMVAGLRAELDFSWISKQAEQLYGPLGAGKSRIDSWQRMLQQQAEATDEKKLDAVNRFFNVQLRFRPDQQVWGRQDYWATPVEALIKGMADCEDYAVAKYFSLRALGVPREKLRITYVKAIRLNQAHMVLTYYPSPLSIPLVLDNLFDAIEPASERRDLVPVYAFNAEGVWMPGPIGGKPVGDSKRLSRWQDLLRKMRAEGFPDTY
jgi:predicted transglutaminase-like cysteine proteinase